VESSPPLRFLKPSVRCPHCKRSPRFRIEASERDNHERDDPNRVLASLQCHNCGGVYEVTARAYQGAA
jgi:transposase-like protein